MRSNTRIVAALTAVALVSSVSTAAAKRGSGNDRDTLVRAQCSASSTAKLKLSPENGRIEAEFEVDQNRNGDRWTWAMAGRSGTAVTIAPSGSFEVRRVLRNAAGPDTVTASARNSRTGETCRVTAVANF